MNMEDKGLIVQAEAGQRAKDTAAIGTGLHLLHKLLLLPKFEKAGEYKLTQSVRKGNPAYFYIYDVLGYK